VIVGDIVFGALLIAGIALVRWHRRLADANMAANRAAADSLGFRWMQRWLEKAWVSQINRGTSIAVGVIWIAVAVIGLVATNAR
jgi:hypothetical protein